MVVPQEKRFLLLFTFLKKNQKKKMMVFFSSCMAVKYYNELLNYIDIPVLSIHVRSNRGKKVVFLIGFSVWQGKQKQAKRTHTFFEFCNAETGSLLCTDVAARGLDIPAVDWIVQFDPPDDPKVRRSSNDMKLVHLLNLFRNIFIVLVEQHVLEPMAMRYLF